MSDNNENQYKPDWVSPPGDTIKDILTDKKIEVADFATWIGLSYEETERLLTGKMMISLELAIKLGQTIGSTSQFWLKRDQQYWESLAQHIEEPKPINDYVIVAIEDAFFTARGNLEIARGKVVDAKKVLKHEQTEATRIMGRLTALAEFIDQASGDSDFMAKVKALHEQEV